jgi:hypothetical protein
LPKRERDNISLREWIDIHGTDFVVKVRGGKPYISRKPKRNPARKKSDAEQKQVNLFKLAVEHAREVMADEEKKAEYSERSEKENRSIYHLAISDYIQKHKAASTHKLLEVEEIVAEKTGQHLFLKINFAEPVIFVKMTITLYELDRTIVEEGAAEQATVKSWWYLIKHPDIAGLPFRANVKAHSPDDAVHEAERVIV